MPVTAQKTAPTYLREARLAAGFPNRDTASTEVPFSPETIGRHERGDVPLTPEDALVYARHYNRDDLTIRYCTDCPVGQAAGWTASDRDLPFATLRLTQRLRRAASKTAENLERIADDGIVDAGERPAFDASLEELKELVATATDIILYAACQGIEKSRPEKSEAAPSNQGYSITQKQPRQSPAEREEART